MDFPLESRITVEKLSKWSATILIVEIRLFWSLNHFLCWCFTMVSWKLPRLESYDFLGPFDQLIFLFELFTLLHFKPVIRLLTPVFFVYLTECLDCNLRWPSICLIFFQFSGRLWGHAFDNVRQFISAFIIFYPLQVELWF